MKKPFKKLKIVFILITILAAGLWLLNLYNADSCHFEQQTRFMMDTYVTISALGPKQIASSAVNSALERMQEIDVKFNLLNPKSPIYAFNQKAEAIADPQILGLIRTGLEVSKESGGAFDITVAPLVELWGFYKKSFHLAQEEEIKGILGNVGYQHLWLANGKLEKDNPGVEIDLGGIAKGYALEQAVKVLKAKGITSALIDAGGDIYTIGKRGKRLWKVGIRNPRADNLLGYIEVEDIAVMSSGDYERFFIYNGKRYHHIFNPKTGYPTEGISSVTLIYPEPILAQAWSKIPFVMGPKKGLELLGKIPNMEAIIVTDSGEILYSHNLKHKLNIIPESK